ncbi:MAG: N-acetylglucosamine-6-phosphate deacetylase, partial [Leucobacter sp.]|nr:N-acetylglucosamine-6-phosphate deacetylase [Leucobacter sp.]
MNFLQEEIMNMKAIVNTNIVMEDHIILDGVILFDETIIEIKEKDNLEIPQNAEIIDARGNYTTPGFIDIHNHGCDGMWMFEKPKEVSAHFLEHGTTTTLCNIFYNMDLEGYLRGIETIRSFLKSEGPHTIIGFYMEGPYMNSKYGADSKNNKWNHPISEDEYRKLVDSAGDLVKVWCIAPEREGIEEFCRYAREVNPDVLFSVGHSEAKPDMIYKLKKYGLRNQTHIMNATGIVNPLCAENKPCGIRDCGPDEAVLYDNDIYAEMIVDK